MKCQRPPSGLSYWSRLPSAATKLPLCRSATQARAAPFQTFTSALEVEMRKEIELLEPVPLARRRAELDRLISDAAKPLPVTERLAALDRRIDAAMSRMESLSSDQAESTGRGHRDSRRSGPRRPVSCSG